MLQNRGERKKGGVGQCGVVANDSGGLIAQRLVIEAPHRVRSLLLTNCETQNDCPPPSFLPFVRLAQAGGLADTTIAPVLANKPLARSARGLGGIGYANPLNPTDEAIEMYFAPIVSSPKRKAQYDALTVGRATTHSPTARRRWLSITDPSGFCGAPATSYSRSRAPTGSRTPSPTHVALGWSNTPSYSFRKNSRTLQRRKQDGCGTASARRRRFPGPRLGHILPSSTIL